MRKNDMSENVTSHVLNQSTDETNEPQTATKPVRVPKKRGRKGDKIARAFREVPTTPVDFEQYAADHGVSPNVLRQIKRHDRFPEKGKVYVRKNKTTKKMEIWREEPTT
jgi:hypothetical protein